MLFTKIFAKKRLGKEILPEDIFLDSRNLSNLVTENASASFSKPVIKSSAIFVSLATVFIFCIFTYRAYTLQIRDHHIWLEKSNNNTSARSPIFAYRGMIKDRNGVALAWNESADNKPTDYIPRREYIEAEGFSNLLGYVSYPKQDKSGVFWQEQYLGKEGLEKEYNEHLSGINGARILETNVKSEIIKSNTLNLPKTGQVLYTSIDSRVQSIFYKNLKETVSAQNFSGGAGVLLDINTGEVIAAASYPDYNNNVFVNATSSEDKKKKDYYLKDKKTPMLSRAISGLYTPGSVVKPFIAYAAIKEKVIDEYGNIFSSGKLIIKNKYDGPDTVFRDWKAHGYVDAREAIAVSSDEYFYQVGGGYEDQEGLGIRRIDAYMSMFGFASTTGIDFPKEDPGIIPTPEWKKKNFKEGEWLLGNTYHSSIGQYGFKTSPIGLARSVGAIASGGRLVTPRLASSTAHKEGSSDIYVALDEDSLKVAREGMRDAAKESGTAHYFSNLPFAVAAKTGTAQLGVNNERVNSWSTGYYPYDNPKYVFVLLMEGGPSTNTVAASKVMRKVFQDMLDAELSYVRLE